MAEQTKQSASEKYRALMEQAQKHKGEATTELRARIQEMVTELNDLGHHYRLVDGGGASGAHNRRNARRAKDPSKPCGICGFATAPPHDARLKAHRNQGDTKKALNARQLEEAGLAKV